MTDEPGPKDTAIPAQLPTSETVLPKSDENTPPTNGDQKPLVDEWGLPMKKKPVVVDSPEDGVESAEKPSEETQDPEKAETESPAPNDELEKLEEIKKDVDERPKTPPNPEVKPDATAIVESPKVNKKTTSSRVSGTHVSEWSHQQLAPHTDLEGDVEEKEKEEEWQTMPAYAPFDLYNDDNKLIAKEAKPEDEEQFNYSNMGGAAKGYTRVQMDEDAQSATSMDDNTAYLFKETTTHVLDDDEEGRDVEGQMQTTKTLLTEGQRIAYVGIVRLAMINMVKFLHKYEKNRRNKKMLEFAIENTTLWSQSIMLRIYSHMEIESAEQIMIEQLTEHGIQPEDLTPTLMQNARIKNPLNKEEEEEESKTPPVPLSQSTTSLAPPANGSGRPSYDSRNPNSPGLYDEHEERSPIKFSRVEEKKKGDSSSDSFKSAPSSAIGSDNGKEKVDHVTDIEIVDDLADKKDLDIDIRWTVLCDLFLLLIADGTYDARSRRLLELVGEYLQVPWIEICRFEKRVTDAIEMQEAKEKETWDEEGHMEIRAKQNRNKRLLVMGLATVGGGIVIGLSAGLLAPVIGAGLAAGFTTFGVAGTGTFLAGAGGATIITTTGIVTGGNIAFNASDRRTGAVKTFEYRPLHNNKRANLIVTVAGWLTGKVDDVRLPFSTVDPIMGDIYSVFWEPEMLQSMGDTINILATEALTQALQQVLGSTILVALMSAIQLPIVLTKLAYIIDNPWTVSVARADLAGLILADSLVDKNLGNRPITLVGFSLGARVIIACLKELVKKEQIGIIQNVYLFGSPVVVNRDDYIKMRAIVSGRFVNGYATNDWILGYLFRATSGGVMRVAGLAPVEIEGIENYNVSEWVPGHMSYRTAMPRLLREVGWVVESDEFTEIEDPDPENHEKRQRELINEIEEARKQLEASKKPSRFAFFKRKKAPEKKEWETYDEKTREGTEESPATLEGKAGGVLFDIEALRAEVAELAAQGIVVKELPESTLPPMRLDLSNSGMNSPETRASIDDRSSSAPPGRSAFSTPPGSAALTNPERSPPQSLAKTAAIGATMGVAGAAVVGGGLAATKSSVLERATSQPELDSPSSFRPPLLSSATAPSGANISLEHNAWADEFDEDFGQEKEVTMTF